MGNRRGVEMSDNASVTDREEMFAVVVREAGDPNLVRGSRSLVETRVLPQVRKAPGIVSAVFLTDEEGHTLNVFVFENEEAAHAALEPVRRAPRPAFLRLEDASLHEVLARF
jgi:hypothetical protein